MQSFVFSNALSFSVFQNTSNQEINFSSKQLYFQSSIDYTEMRAAPWGSYFFANKIFSKPSCLEELLLSNNYFLVTNTFSDQLLLEYKCFFSTATIMFQRSYFCRIQNIYFFDADSSSKELLFQKKNLFRSRCFLLHYIYIGKDFPLTIIYSFKYTIGYTI